MTAAACAVQRLVEIRLHGHLGAQFGRVHHLAVDTAAEAIVALGTLYSGFRQALRDFTGPGYRVRVGEGERATWREESTLGLGLGRARRIDIVPVIHGAKRNGWGQIILGAVIAVVGYFTAAYDGGATMSFGISMMLGGAVALLTPVPKGSDSKAGQEVSQQLNGPPNVISAGGPVPLIIGRMLVGSVTISAGLSTDAVPIASTAPTAPALPPEEPVDWFDHGGDFGA